MWSILGEFSEIKLYADANFPVTEKGEDNSLTRISPYLTLHTHTCRQTHRQADTRTHTHARERTHTQAGRYTGTHTRACARTHTNRQADRHIHRHAEIHTSTLTYYHYEPLGPQKDRQRHSYQNKQQNDPTTLALLSLYSIYKHNTHIGCPSY